ncbi:MAG: ABC transporter permease [Acidimicrobiales bacterium]|nr:ABC transporter permease [Acidimicrobiales bacterium]
MNHLVEYLIRGIPIGCVFALVAVGIVLTYKTSGVLNLAFGAQAYVSAATFYVLRDPARTNWPMVPALIVSVLLLAPALGWLLDRVLYRHLRTAPPVAKLVTSLGLLVAIPELVKLDFLLGATQKPRPPGIATESIVLTLGNIRLDGNQVVTIVAAAVSVGGLTLLFRATNLGLQMRAVVESPRMTELAGVNADAVGTFSWMLSSFFAGLAGVLLAPLFGQLNSLDYLTLLVAALAAAAFGRLVSIPVAVAGGLGLGFAQNLAAGYLNDLLPEVLATSIRQALPFLALFLVLLLLPGIRRTKESTDPLAGVDPPPPAPVAAVRSRGLTIATRVTGAVAVGGGTLVTATLLDPFWLRIVTQGVILAVILLSVLVVTGLAGQISLCQASFAAIGALITAHLASRMGMSVLLAIAIGAAATAIVGALVALPALRIGGIHLALATLAFAVMFETVIMPIDSVNGGSRQLRVPRPLLFGIDFASDKAFFVLTVACLCLAAGAVLLLKYGTTGRFLDAVRGSEIAAASIGISPGKAKIVAFAISAAIAGFGGGLLASFEKQMGSTTYQGNFSFVVGLVWVVLVITLGSRTVQGAVNAGLSFMLFPQLLEKGLHLSGSVAQTIAFALFGLGAMTYAKHPEGIIDAQTRRAVNAIMRRLRRTRVGTPDSDPEGKSPTVVAPTSVSAADLWGSP